MKARLDNGQIRTYNRIPRVWVPLNIVGGFQHQPTSVHESEGFFDVVTPSLNTYQKLGDIFFDTPNLVFTYPVVDFTAEEIEDYEETLLLHPQ